MSQLEIDSLNSLKAFVSKNKVTLVDFYATWCGPCKRIAPYVIQKCQQNGVALAKVNVDVAKDATAYFKIRSMPTFKLLDYNGNTITEVSGGSEANVDKLVQLARSYA